MIAQFSRSVVSDSLQPHELQHARPPCPSPTPGVHSDSRPSSQCCHPATSSSVVPFSSCPQSIPASESFPMCSRICGWTLEARSRICVCRASFLMTFVQSGMPPRLPGHDQCMFSHDISAFSVTQNQCLPTFCLCFHLNL